MKLKSYYFYNIIESRFCKDLDFMWGFVKSKLKDSIKLASLESRFYKTIESSNLDSKMQNSHLHFLAQSILTRPPFFKINIKSANANFANAKDYIESSLQICKRFSPCESALDSMFRPFPPIKNLSQIHRAKIYTNKKLVDLESRFYENTKNNNLNSKNLVIIESNLESKNIRIKTSSDSLTINGDVRSTNLVSPPNSQCKKAESTHAAVRVSAFLQRVGKAGLAPFKTKKRLLFFAKGARGGGYALFCALCRIESKNDILKNNDQQKLDSIESSTKDFIEKLVDLESRFYKTYEIYNYKKAV